MTQHFVSVLKYKNDKKAGFISKVHFYAPICKYMYIFGQSVHRSKVCPIHFWRTPELIVLKLDREVGHDQLMTTFNTDC